MKILRQRPKISSFVLSILAVFLALAATSCKEEVYAPKPRGFYRIDLPEKSYTQFQADYCPCTFNYPEYAEVERKTKYFNEAPDHPCWLNIDLPQFNGKIYLSYVELDSPEKLEQVINDGYKYAFKHTIKADFIDQTLVNENGNYGVLFDIGGNVASSVQFFMTDSTDHYLRGSLYFDEHPNVDSLRPVIDFLREDVKVLMESLEWI